MDINTSSQISQSELNDLFMFEVDLDRLWNKYKNKKIKLKDLVSTVWHALTTISSSIYDENDVKENVILALDTLFLNAINSSVIYKYNLVPFYTSDEENSERYKYDIILMSICYAIISNVTGGSKFSGKEHDMIFDMITTLLKAIKNDDEKSCIKRSSAENSMLH